MENNNVIISTKQYQEMINKITALEKKIDRLLRGNAQQEKWLTIDETCQILKISRRTLQNYRDKNLLPFSQVGNKIYFKASDVYGFLEQNYRRGK